MTFLPFFDIMLSNRHCKINNEQLAMSNEQLRKGFSAPLAGEVAINAIGGLKIRQMLIAPLPALQRTFPARGTERI